VKAALVKGEAEAYKQSVKEFTALCEELQNVKDVLRGARMAHEATLSRAQREALQYAQGFNDGKAAALREDAERLAWKTQSS